MGPLRVLVVDDSALFRTMVRDALARIPRVEVVGHAADGKAALEQIAKLDPDLLTLDIQMPELDGLGVLREMKGRGLRSRALVLSSLTSEGAEITTEALLEGAWDFLLKPVGSGREDNLLKLRLALASKLRAFRADGLARDAEHRDEAVPAATVAAVPATPAPALRGPFRALLIGCSTGGPEALRSVLPALPADFPLPVVVVQHMPPMYTLALARRLDGLAPLTVSEAGDGDSVAPGRILLAPGGRHLALRAVPSAHPAARPGAVARVALADDPPLHGCRPSVDYLFRSAVEALDVPMLGVVLTGIGRDGADGAARLRAAGGRVLAQAREGCTVFGMPKAVIEAGAADGVVPLPRIAGRILREVARAARSGGDRND